MISLNTNITSMLVRTNFRDANSGLTQALERMTTGYRINRAKDDAAGYSIVNTMESKLSSYAVAQDNAEIGLSYLNTAEGNLELVTEHLQRIRDLTEQAANGTYSTDSRMAIQAEIDQRISEINRVLETAEYNGLKLFSAGASAIGTFSLARTASALQSTTSETTTSTFSLARTITVDDTKRVSNVSSFTSGETYYITTSDDLVALQDLTNSGVSTLDVIFELANDLDMTGVNFRGIGTSSSSFQGAFNGNDYTISNLAINTTEREVGLFGYAYNATIQNINLENVDITGGDVVGSLVGRAFSDCVILNCTASGNVSGDTCVGGFVGVKSSIRGSFTDCSTSCDVNGNEDVGGFLGYAAQGFTSTNCYSTGNVTGNDRVGGFFGTISLYQSSNVHTNCYSTGIVQGSTNIGGFGGYADYDNIPTITDCYYNSQDNPGLSAFGYATFDTSAVQPFTTLPDTTDPDDGDDSGSGTGGTTDPDTGTTDPDSGTTGGGSGSGTGTGGSSTSGGGSVVIPEGSIGFFVGIHGVQSSVILTNTQFSFALDVDVSSAATASAALEDIDAVLKEVNAMQTQIGTASNRLESVLDSINTNIETLTSSVSTMRDADIAEESTKYIQQQILQNACATLLATANQNPSIALALINGANL